MISIDYIFQQKILLSFVKLETLFLIVTIYVMNIIQKIYTRIQTHMNIIFNPFIQEDIDEKKKEEERER
jgi:hypothetical protein